MNNINLVVVIICCLLAELPRHDAFSHKRRTRPHSSPSSSTQLQAGVSAAAAPSLQYLAGRRCLFSPCRNAPLKEELNPPLIILGGTAQSVYSWEHHLPPLSRDRDVIVYELLGQGPENASIEDLSNVTLAFHVDDFVDVVDAAFDSILAHHRDDAGTGDDGLNRPKVDVAGFSLGGRVALAAASCHPHRIRRLHLTGVAARRDAYAQTILASWKDILSKIDDSSADGNDQSCEAQLRAFAWSTILNTYSQQFVADQGSDRIQRWVRGIVSQNTVKGLRALLQQTHESTDNHAAIGDEWSPSSLAEKIGKLMEEQIASSPESRRRQIKLCVGSEDRMALPVEVERLSDILETGKHEQEGGKEAYMYSAAEFGNEAVAVIQGAGHAVPMERGREWRRDLLQFL